MITSAPQSRAVRNNLLKLGRTLVKRLVVCLKTSRLYDTEHSTVREAAEEVVRTVQIVDAIESTVRLETLLDYLSLNDVRLKSDIAGHAVFRTLVDTLHIHGVGEVQFASDLSPRDVIVLCRALSRRADPTDEPLREMQEFLDESGVTAVSVGPPSSPGHDASASSAVTDPGDLKGLSVEAFNDSVHLVRDILTGAGTRQMDFRRAKRVIHQMVDIMAEEDHILLSLATIKLYDESTYHHCTNVAIYAIAVGQRIGLNRQELADLGIAGLFHDLGKTRVPKEILRKPGRLDDAEWVAVKNHTIHGVEMLLENEHLNDTTIRSILVAFEHHLHLDMEGYPALRDRRDIHVFSKIVAIADTYDALTTPRSYRNLNYSPAQALSILSEARGTHFEPVLIKVFANCIGVLPIGTLLELDSGELAVVVRTNQIPGELDRPFVKIFADADGARIPERIADLSQRNAGGVLEHVVTRTLEPGECFDSITEYLEVL